MKKLLSVLAVLLICHTGIAQERYQHRIIIKDGRAYIKDAGREFPTGETVTIKGNAITMDGYLTTPDGTRVKMQEGDEVYFDGSVIKVKALEVKNQSSENTSGEEK